MLILSVPPRPQMLALKRLGVASTDGGGGTVCQGNGIMGPQDSVWDSTAQKKKKKKSQEKKGNPPEGTN